MCAYAYVLGVFVFLGSVVTLSGILALHGMRSCVIVRFSFAAECHMQCCVN